MFWLPVSLWICCHLLFLVIILPLRYFMVVPQVCSICRFLGVYVLPQDWTIPVVFMGYSLIQKGYMVMSLIDSTFHVSRDVFFHEHINFPFSVTKYEFVQLFLSLDVDGPVYSCWRIMFIIHICQHSFNAIFQLLLPEFGNPLLILMQLRMHVGLLRWRVRLRHYKTTTLGN